MAKKTSPKPKSETAPKAAAATPPRAAVARIAAAPKAKAAKATSAAAIADVTGTPTFEQIAKRAYELYITGAPGSEADHWHQAERELRDGV